MNWSRTDNIFLDGYEPNDEERSSYVDCEVEGALCADDLTGVFRELDLFLTEAKFVGEEQKQLENETECEPWDATLKTYKSGSSQLVFVHTPEDWAILYGGPKHFLVVKNAGSHPSVITDTFYFSNSDGSTWDALEKELTLEQIISLAKSKSLEYLFEQIH